MPQKFGTIAIGIACVLGFASYASIKALDAATARQCATHDWPKQLDQVHRDFCIGSGYQL